MSGQFRGNPIGCGKIRMRIPHLTSQVDCNCELSGYPGAYPHPLLHLHSPTSAAEIDSAQFQALLEDFQLARRQQLEEVALPTGKLVKDPGQPGGFRFE